MKDEEHVRVMTDPGGGASLTTDPAAGTSSATDVSLKMFFEAVRAGDLRWLLERDRRYAEVQAEREKAIKIKETADRDAMELARDIQTYKDEKANELRSQIERERGTYVTQQDLKGAVEKIEAMIAPLAEYVTQTRGAAQGQREVKEQQGITVGYFFGGLGAFATIIGLLILFANYVTG